MNLVRQAFGIEARLCGKLDLETSPHGGFLLCAGSHVPRYLLKPMASYRSMPSFAESAEVYLDLTRRGAPVAPLVPASNGAAWVDLGDFKATLQHWIDGVPLVFHAAQDRLDLLDCHFAFLACARDIARRSHAMQAFDPAGIWDTPAGFARILDGLSAQIGDCDPHLNAIIEQISDAVRAAVARIAWEELPQQYIHGDPGTDNGIRGNDGVLLIDLCDLRWSFRIWDPSRLIASCSIRVDTERHMAIDFDRETFGRSLLAMTCDPRLSAEEARDIGPIMRLATVATVFSESSLDWEILGYDPPRLLRDPQKLAIILEALVDILADSN